MDDDFRVAALHADFVNRIEGFTVPATVHTGRAAVEATARIRPDLVLLDLYLPDEDGLTVLGKLREGGGPHSDVIAITAARDLPSIRTAMQRGVVHYLVKPFTFARLRSGWMSIARYGREHGRAIADRVGISRATAQRYLALLVREGPLELHLRYGVAGRPEHRYSRRG